MPIHPHPNTMATHVEHHRQELLKQAQQERMAREALAGGPARNGLAEATAAAVGQTRAIFARLRPALTAPMELPQSQPGEAQ